MVDSPLGPMKDRIKTDVRLPKRLSSQVDEVCEMLGMNRNCFMTMAIAKFAIDVGRLEPSSKKRRTLLREVRKVFDDLAEELEKAA